ncbi:MAG: PAS domain-containing sensor histidine kinase, partial [Algoriphagus sp.]
MISDFFNKLLDSEFMPHGHCYYWDPIIVWVNAISGSLIALAYLTIPFTLIYIVRKRNDIKFSSVVLLFALFILSCSATHIMDVINIWEPMYRLDSTFRVITAIASVATAFMLMKITPQILSIPNADNYKKL